MAKPDSWRLEMENYPFQVSIDTRYQDLDVMGHVNNVAMAGLFETGRIRFHRSLGRHPRDKGVRWLVAAVNIAYVNEAHFRSEEHTSELQSLMRISDAVFCLKKQIKQ